MRVLRAIAFLAVLSVALAAPVAIVSASAKFKDLKPSPGDTYKYLYYVTNSSWSPSSMRWNCNNGPGFTCTSNCGCACLSVLLPFSPRNAVPALQMVLSARTLPYPTTRPSTSCSTRSLGRSAGVIPCPWTEVVPVFLPVRASTCLVSCVFYLLPSK